MSAKKKTISRVLCLVMIVALIVPALLVVPVSAESEMYLYNGIELPSLPIYDSVAYPDVYITVTSDGTFLNIVEKANYQYVGLIVVDL